MIKFTNVRLDGGALVHQWLNALPEGGRLLEGTLILAACPRCRWGYFSHEPDVIVQADTLQQRANEQLSAECPDHPARFWIDIII